MSYQFTENQVQDALAIVGQGLARDYRIKVIWSDDKRVCADVVRRVVRLPRLSCVSTMGMKDREKAMELETALNLTRSNALHEFGHCAFTVFRQGDQPKPGALFQILNALEDVRMERRVVEDRPGYCQIFLQSNCYHNQKIAGEKIDGKPSQPLWEALCACIFQSQGIVPAWDLKDRAKAYFDLAYPEFVKVLVAKDVYGCLDIAKRIFELLKDLLKEERNQQKQQQKQQKRQQEKQQQEGGEPGESDESGEEGQSEGDGEEKEDQKQGKGQQEDGEEESGEGSDADADADEENAESAGKEDAQDSGADEAGEDEEDGVKGGGETKGGGAGDESDAEDDADDGDDEDDSEDGDAEEGEDKPDKGHAGGGKGSDDSHADEDGPKGYEENGDCDEDDAEADAEAEKQLEKDAEGQSLSERGNDAIEKALEDVEMNDRDIYTSRRDMDQHLTPTVDDELRNDFRKNFDQMQQEVAAMALALEQSLRALTRCRKNAFLRAGRMDSDRLVEIAKNLSRDVFYQKRPGRDLKTAVSMVIDQSGSMTRIDDIRDLVILLSECLSRLNIPFEIVGTTTTSEGMPPLEDFSRTKPIVYYHYKTFSEQWAVVRERTMRMANIDNNIDGEAVEFAVRRLLDRSEDRRIVFSLCDGEPCGGQGNDTKLAANITKVAETARASGVEVYGVGIGTDRPAKCYGEENFVYLENNTEKGQKFVRAFAEILTQGAVRV